MSFMYRHREQGLLVKSERKPVFKADPELQLVWGVVYSPGFPDSQGDFMTAVEVRKMAHSFMSRGGSPDYGMKCCDVDHDGSIRKVCVVESFIARKGDPDFREGSWVIGAYIEDPSIWESIKKGEFNGFSMEALVYDQPQDLDVEFPDCVEGTTLKADIDDHNHIYRVMLNPEGQIIGGETSYTNGHRHLIKRGTITEEADGHKHRFSFLDELDICA
jgi:hypothetical protein